MSGTVEVDETGSDSRSAKGATWVRRSEVPPFSPAPGIQIQPVIGESLMTCWIAMEPGAVVAEHSHVNEQLGVVVEGSVTLTVAGETRELVVGTPTSCPRSRAQRGCRGEWGPAGRNLRAGPRGVRQGLASHRRRIIVASRCLSRCCLAQSGIGPVAPDCSVFPPVATSGRDEVRRSRRVTCRCPRPFPAKRYDAASSNSSRIAATARCRRRRSCRTTIPRSCSRAPACSR